LFHIQIRNSREIKNQQPPHTVPYDDAAAVIAVQSFGDLLGFNSHLHVIATDPPSAEKTWHVGLVRCYSDGNLPLKNPAAGMPVGYTRICLNAQLHLKK
jgi:hypothetical protein